MSRVAKAPYRLGFPEAVELGDLRSVAHLLGTTMRRTGVYALALPGESACIGKATVEVRRFAQHRLVHQVIPTHLAGPWRFT